jgi:hypothetical protein
MLSRKIKIASHKHFNLPNLIVHYFCFLSGYICVAVLRNAFNAFDREKNGSISVDFVPEILRLMGQPFNQKTLEELIDEVDADSKYQINFPDDGKQKLRVNRIGFLGVRRVRAAGCQVHE